MAINIKFNNFYLVNKKKLNKLKLKIIIFSNLSILI